MHISKKITTFAPQLNNHLHSNSKIMFGVDTLIKLFCCALLSLMAVQWIFFRILKIAKIKHLEDVPDARKIQKQPTPFLGGLAVFFGLSIGLILAACLFPEAKNLLPVLLCCTVMLYVGSIDDVLGINPGIRAIIEALTILGLIYSTNMCIDSFHGLWGIEAFSWYWGVPLTVFVGVGIINAFNMIDGVNGLSSLLCIACSSLLGAIFYKMGDPADAALAFCFAGALATFAVHNIFGRKSCMFIGDGGTMVMGLLVSWFVIRIMSHQGLANNQMDALGMNTIAMLLAVVCVPVFDTLRVMFTRIARRKSPFAPDKTHLHHLFIELGYSHIFTSLMEVLLGVLVTLIWYLSYKVGLNIEMQLYIVLAAAFLIIGGTTAVLSYCIAHEDIKKRIYDQSTKSHPKDTKWWCYIRQLVDYRAFELDQDVEEYEHKKTKFNN